MTDIVERLHVAPATIWLQVDPTEEFLPDAAAWCIDKINDSDVGYVRADIIDFLHQQLAECQKEAQQWFVRMQQENDSAIALEEQLAECQAREKASPRSNYEKGVFNPVFDSPPEPMEEELK
jgi:hypothetical protein